MTTPTQFLRPLPDVPRWPTETPLFYQKQLRVLGAISCFHTLNGYPPSIQDLTAHLKLSTDSLVHRLLVRLRDKGIVTWQPGQSRTLTITYSRKEK